MTAALIETPVVSPQCAILSPAFKVREFSITDVAPYPISLKWHSAAEEGVRYEETDLCYIFDSSPSF